MTTQARQATEEERQRFEMQSAEAMIRSGWRLHLDGSIYDSFPDYQHAGAFVDAVRERRPELRVTVFTDDAEANARKFFSFELRPPIVVVGRDEDFNIPGDDVDDLAAVYGGTWVGT
jgi:hypothetical protein